MVKVRFAREGCINCGAQFPVQVRRYEDHGYIVYECPRCGATIVQGIVATGGTFAQTHRYPPPELNDISVGDSTDWDTWEMWWTERTHVAAFHGRVVQGERALLDFVEQLTPLSTNDSP
jgi:DNA-directed RNA polymerase subunit RPC12/RpoP